MAAITSPPVIIEPFAINGDRNVIPVPSQIGILPGAWSFDTGAPPLNSQTVGPTREDMNGILYMISAYAAWIQAGGFFVWSAAVVSAGGYPIHATIRSVSDFTKFWYNTVDGNVHDPDSDPTGWTQYSIAGGGGSGGTGVQTPSALPAGNTNNLALTNTSVRFLEVSANAAGSVLTGVSGGADGQMLTVTNGSANSFSIAALSGSSTAGNRFRLPTDLSLLQNQSATFIYSSTLAVWVAS